MIIVPDEQIHKSRFQVQGYVILNKLSMHIYLWSLRWPEGKVNIAMFDDFVPYSAPL